MPSTGSIVTGDVTEWRDQGMVYGMLLPPYARPCPASGHLPRYPNAMRTRAAPRARAVAEGNMSEKGRGVVRAGSARGAVE